MTADGKNGREIKFRAWDVKGKRWVGHNIHIDGSGVLCWAFGDSCHVVGREQFVIEQFTGLLDKNGREIYEGDILKCSKDYGWLIKKTAGWSGIVTYVSTCGSYYLDTLDRCGTYTRNQPWEWGEYEVIGNIHENPELLEAKP